MATDFLTLTFRADWQNGSAASAKNPCIGHRHFKVSNDSGGGDFVRKQEPITYSSLRKWAFSAAHDAGLLDLAQKGNAKVTTSSLLTFPHQVVYWVSLCYEELSADYGAPVFSVGDCVQAQFGGEDGEWYRGKVTKNTLDGCYSILYDDGDTDDDLLEEYVRMVHSEGKWDNNKRSSRRHHEILKAQMHLLFASLMSFLKAAAASAITSGQADCRSTSKAFVDELLPALESLIPPSMEMPLCRFWEDKGVFKSFIGGTSMQLALRNFELAQALSVKLFTQARSRFTEGTGEQVLDEKAVYREGQHVHALWKGNWFEAEIFDASVGEDPVKYNVYANGHSWLVDFDQLQPYEQSPKQSQQQLVQQDKVDEQSTAHSEKALVDEQESAVVRVDRDREKVANDDEVDKYDQVVRGSTGERCEDEVVIDATIAKEAAELEEEAAKQIKNDFRGNSQTFFQQVTANIQAEQAKQQKANYVQGQQVQALFNGTWFRARVVAVKGEEDTAVYSVSSNGGTWDVYRHELKPTEQPAKQSQPRLVRQVEVQQVAGVHAVEEAEAELEEEDDEGEDESEYEDEYGDDYEDEDEEEEEEIVVVAEDGKVLAEEGEERKEGKEGDGTWVCTGCTLINKEQDVACKLCPGSRPRNKKQYSTAVPSRLPQSSDVTGSGVGAFL